MWRMLCVTERSLILSFNAQRNINKVYSRYDLSYGVTKNLGPRIFRALLLDLTALDGGGALCPSLLLLKIIDKPVDEISKNFFCFLGNYHRIIFLLFFLF